MTPRTGWLGAGLFFATLATLLLETLDARLLSVLTWYHLSFFAVSLAMLGMAAGAVFVFLHPEWFGPEQAPRALARVSWWLAAAIPASHFGSLAIPFLPLNEFTAMEIVSIAVSTVVLAIPFALSGVAVTVALTRCGGRIGRLYALDLVGAACGCLLVVPLLEKSNISSAVLIAGAAAAIAAFCFHQFAGVPGRLRTAALAIALVGGALLNGSADPALQVIYPKNRSLWLTNAMNAKTAWNSHSYVLVQQPGDEAAFMWGPGRGGDQFKSRIAWLAIDGEAGTPITQWNGDVAALDWVSYNVTSLPYYLRRGNVAIVGLGGGRDVLSALWGRNPSIVAIDVNKIMVDLLQNSHRDFASLAKRPEVTLVHDDGRAWLTRTDKRFDVIQMSLVDTWAATGAGAFTLSENGLYTLDAWRMFLNRLAPGGVLSVSRWFDPKNVSETSRLLALGVAALLDRGVARPMDHIALVVRGRVATLMVSNEPLRAEDRDTLTRVAGERDFQILVSPWTPVEGGARLEGIARSTTAADLARATEARDFDYSPPTDRRPYYFNMLKPVAYLHTVDLPKGGALWGNLRATFTLLVLLAVSVVLVALIIIWPLIKSGRPPMAGGAFATTMAYFAIIGFAYMLIQIGLLQRFSVYLGHPTYTLAIVLFSMLLFTGIGAVISERLTVGRTGAFRLVPLGIAGALAIVALALPPAIAATVTGGLLTRTLVVLTFAAPLSMLLGLCFPIGVRLVQAAPSVVAWAWGVNGAFGVLASILAVCISLWIEIDANFWAAAGLYAILALPLAAMARGTDKTP